MSRLIFICLLFFSFRVGAAAHNKGILSSINIGVRFASILEHRGTVNYHDFQIDPVLSFSMFDDRLQYLGDSLGYNDFVYGDRVRLRTRIVSISDKPFFPAHESVKNNFPDRKSTYEWASRIELFLPGYNDSYWGEFDLQYSKDVSQHLGNYWDLEGKVKLFQFRAPLIRYLIEPQFFVNVGWGDARHNKYFYGPSADQNGINNVSYGLWFSFPEDADRYFPVIQLSRFEVYGDSNQG